MAVLDEPAHTCIDRFTRWAFDRAGEYGLAVQQIAVHLWESLEEPQHRDVVIDVFVRGGGDAALRFWGEASDALGALVEEQPTPAARLLSVDVHWR